MAVRRNLIRGVVLGIGIGAAQHGMAQTGDDSGTGEQITENMIIRQLRQSGMTISDFLPELQLDQSDIQSYGVGTIQELLDELAPQLAGGRGRSAGRPVMLVNGRRISSFREIHSYPTEAIQRMDVLPPEAALAYGYRADQRVVNIVLVDSFNALTTEVEGETPTAGDGQSGELSASFLRIHDGGRWNINGEIQHRGTIRESDRDLPLNPDEALVHPRGNILPAMPGAEIDPALSALAGVPVVIAGVPFDGSFALADFLATANRPNELDTGRYRTLQGRQTGGSLGGSYSRTIGDGIGLTVTAGVDHTVSESLLGLPEVSLTLTPGSPYSPFGEPVELVRSLGLTPLTRQSETTEAEAAMALNGQRGGWLWSANAGYTRTERRTTTDREVLLDDVQATLDVGDPALDPFGPLGEIGILEDRGRSISDTLGGEVSANRTLFYVPAGAVSLSVTTGIETLEKSSRRDLGDISERIDLSRTTSRAQTSLDIPLTSSFAVNGNLELVDVSDFGTLAIWGGGLNWSPSDRLRILVSYTSEEGAPTVDQLGDPISVTPNQRAFDYVTGETVFVTEIEGANPALRADRRHVTTLDVDLRPFKEKALSLTGEYLISRTRDAIATFPTPTAAIRAAFPERFELAADGRLLSIDRRAINLAEARSQRLRWGLNYSGRLGGGAAVERVRRGARGDGGRYRLALYYTWQLEDEAEIAPGVPVLDFLKGASTQGTGGSPEHQVNARASFYRGGFGSNISLDWQSGTFLNGGGGSDRLTFSSLATLDIRLFWNPDAQSGLIRALPWLANSRLSLDMDNIFNQRLMVRDETGSTPFNFLPARMDPLGRTIELSLRKQF